MRTTLRVVALAFGASLLHAVILFGLTLAGVGPFGRGLQLVRSGAMDTHSEASSREWFRAAEQSVTLDRFVLWPVVFLVAVALGTRYVPVASWWHPLVIASAVLPLSLPVEGHSWLTQFLAYALLVVILWLLVRRLQSLRVATAAT
jgi:hypothetical protein